jgi:Fe-S-cluster containining protein
LGDHVLHIPEGIRFNCSGCGNCCLHWPVPATDEDVMRIPQASFRRLPEGDARTRGFTYTLEKRPDGRCTFLTEDNRCALHAEGGIEAKPSMCRLFPYSFTPTPSGTYLYVSFASTGVLENFGSPLTEQRSDLEAQQQLFEKLFPHVDDDWSSAQLIDGAPLDWIDYLKLEFRMLDVLKSSSNLLDGLLQCSRIIENEIPAWQSPERMPRVEATAKQQDIILMNALHSLYWPADVFAENSFDLDARSVMANFVKPPKGSTIFGGTPITALLDSELGRLPEKCEDLLHRFVYTRIFGKLYFGRSYAHLSLLAGVHHLFFVVALIRLQLKLRAVEGGTFDFWDVAELLRTCERRMTQMNFSRESCSFLEILLLSPARLERVGSMCA